MRKFSKISIFIIIVQIVLIVVFNVLLLNNIRNNNSVAQYRVECARVIRELKDNKTINLDNYETIISVHEYDQDLVVNNDYKITFVDDTCYQIEYANSKDYSAVIYLNIGFFVLIAFTAGLLIYVNNKILKPFDAMSNVSVELAKGNLVSPVKEDKNKFFGKFIWGINMLRDNIETNREKELALQKEKKMLILSLSHDIKTPLAAIKLYNKALRDNLYKEENKRQEALLGIEKNTLEIERYVSEILTASKEDFLNLEVHNGEFYLSDVMNRIAVYYNDKFNTTHTEFSIDKFENCLIKGDINRLEEVLQNLLENAIKYGDGKSVSITMDNEEDCRLISVTNSGCELKSEELPHLFDSFYRGSNSENQKGSGLGLYIAKTLMRMMDGDIFAQIDGDRFTCVVVARKI